MKYCLFFLLSLFIAQNAAAGTITRKRVYKETSKADIGNQNIISPDEIAYMMHPADKSLEYMLDNYSDRDLRAYAISVNKSERALARSLNQPLPDKLDKETLSDRKQIVEYLRSFYQYRY